MKAPHIPPHKTSPVTHRSSTTFLVRNYESGPNSANQIQPWGPWWTSIYYHSIIDISLSPKPTTPQWVGWRTFLFSLLTNFCWYTGCSFPFLFTNSCSIVPKPNRLEFYLTHNILFFWIRVIFNSSHNFLGDGVSHWLQLPPLCWDSGVFRCSGACTITFAISSPGRHTLGRMTSESISYSYPTCRNTRHARRWPIV